MGMVGKCLLFDLLQDRNCLLILIVSFKVECMMGAAVKSDG